MMRIRKFSILLLLFAVLTLSVPAKASGMIDLTRPGSLAVTMACNGTPVPGGKLALYHVAEILAVDDYFVLAYTEAFRDCPLSLEDVNSDTAAEDFQEYVNSKGITGQEMTIGEDGVALFEDLPLGVYLVMQPVAAPGYYPIKSFMVQLPDGGENGVRYHVDATPKVSVDQGTIDPPDPDEPDIPQTGQLQWPVPVLAICGLVAFSIGWYLCFVKRKTEK